MHIVIVVDQGNIAIPAGLHEIDRVAHGLVEMKRPGMLLHDRLDRPAQIHFVADEAGKDVALGQDASEAAIQVGHEHGIGAARLPDHVDAGGKAGARTDRDRIAKGKDPKLHIRDGWDPGCDISFGGIGHEREV